MQTARPPSGFRIVIAPAAQATIDAKRASFRRLDFCMIALCEHLKIAGMKVGVPVDPDFPSNRVFEFEGDPTYDIPNIAVAYTALGDCLTIHEVIVSR
jgi:hypothetical protein